MSCRSDSVCWLCGSHLLIISFARGWVMRWCVFVCSASRTGWHPCTGRGHQCWEEGTPSAERSRSGTVPASIDGGWNLIPANNITDVLVILLSSALPLLRLGRRTTHRSSDGHASRSVLQHFSVIDLCSCLTFWFCFWTPIRLFQGSVGRNMSRSVGGSGRTRCAHG